MADLATLAREAVPLLDNTSDEPVRLGVMPEHAAGWGSGVTGIPQRWPGLVAFVQLRGL